MSDPKTALSVLEVRGVSKAFPGVQALDTVDFDLRTGEVHALMGENGAGKSTLMRLIAGLLRPDAGEIRVNGRLVTIPDPDAAARLGIGMIHQELLPFPALTVAENVFMGHEPTRIWPGWIDRRRCRLETIRLIARLGGRIDPDTPMSDLSVAEMQTVEIARALAHAARILIMDEPTSAISDREVAALFRLIRELRDAGVAIVYISHRMDEVFRVADRITVLRDGRRVATRAAGDLDVETLITLMVGRALPAGRERPGAGTGTEALRVSGLGRSGRFHNVNFAVRRGEVLGLAGLLGAGRSSVLRAVYGLDPADTGEIQVEGHRVRIRRPQDALRHGIALVTEDRQESGLIPLLSTMHNLTLASLARFSPAGWIRRRAEESAAEEAIRRFRIRVTHRDRPVNHLSGGNQQKVVLARALLTHPHVLLLDEPTRGIDVGAKAEIHARIAQLARDGLAIVVASSEMPELLRLSDRLLVLREGEVSATFETRDVTGETVLRHAMPLSCK